MREQDLQEHFISRNPVTGGVRRVPAFFYLLSLHHRTLLDTVQVQHPRQRPLPFRYVIAVVSGIADALEEAARVGVVHLDIKEENIMADDPEAMEFEAELRAAAPPDSAHALVVDYSTLIRWFERQPVAVVIDWGVAMHFEAEWKLVVRVDATGTLALPEGAQPWGNPAHAGPDLHLEWARAHHALERAKDIVREAHQAKTAAVARTYCTLSGGASRWQCSCCVM